MLAYKIVINSHKVLLNTLQYFKNMIHGNEKPLSNSKILLPVYENVGNASTSESADTGK